MRFVNGALVVLLSVFAVAVVLGAAVGVRSAGQVTVAATSATWAGATRDGSDLVVRITLHNPGKDAVQVVAAQGEASVGDTAIAQAKATPSRAVPPGRDATVDLPVRLPGSFPTTWWAAYAGEAERASLVVRGTVTVERGGAQDEVPFRWDGSWKGSLDDLFDKGVGNCRQAQGLCVEKVLGDWQGKDLAVLLRVLNRGDHTVDVHGGSVDLRLGDVPVATGTLPATSVPAQGGRDVEVVLRFSDTSLGRWWPAHAKRCESSPAELAVDVATDEGDETWQLPGPPYRTRFACDE